MAYIISTRRWREEEASGGGRASHMAQKTSHLRSWRAEGRRHMVKIASELKNNMGRACAWRAKEGMVWWAGMKSVVSRHQAIRGMLHATSCIVSFHSVWSAPWKT